MGYVAKEKEQNCIACELKLMFDLPWIGYKYDDEIINIMY
jgi:hypothetical protein